MKQSLTQVPKHVLRSLLYDNKHVKIVDMTDLQKTYRPELFRTVDKTFPIGMHDKHHEDGVSNKCN